MSITVDYYFNSDKDIESLSSEINSWLGCNLVPYEGNTDDLFCGFLGMELSFGTQTLENDGEINFEKYKYEIGIRNAVPDSDLRNMQIASIAFIANILYHRMKIFEGILVYDVQKLLAYYEQRVNANHQTNGLFDLISKKYVEFPRHIIDMESLVEH